MPRDGSGNYTLPAGNPVIDGTIIEAPWANATMSDIAVQLNNVVTRDGLLGFTAAIKAIDGTPGAPAFTFSGNTAMGFYRVAPSTLGVSIAATTKLLFDNTNFIQVAAAHEIVQGTAPSTGPSLTNKTYVDTAIATAITVGDFLPRAGGSMTGPLTFLETGEGVGFFAGTQIYDSGTTFVAANAGPTVTSIRWYFNSVEKMSLTNAGAFSVAGAGSFGGTLGVGSTLTVLGASVLQAISGTTGSFSSSISSNSSITAAGTVKTTSDWLRVGAVDRGVYSDAVGYGIVMNSDRVATYGSPPYFQGPTALFTGAVYAYYSDERLKTRTGWIHDALNRLAFLDAFLYKHNELAREFGYDDDKEQIGLSAQQVQRVFPQVVGLAPFDHGEGAVSKSGENYLTIQYDRLVPVLVAAINELNKKVDSLVVH